ncbi:odorant receptor 94b-like [Copidosoma floridanum]|uniref:odorant receptor 94b-like n=1 Tax=Copidosoma floridanum TaxID=29053 RepID=UPI000C6F814D|nr:odorant receptor 94b-like [Copidosoma floridanum]
MDALALNFYFLRLSGLWYEENERFGCAKKMYRFIVMVIIFYVTLTLIAKIAVSNSNIGDLTESHFVAMKYLALCFKIINFVFRRDNIIKIIRELKVVYCKANSDEEAKILAKHAKTSKWLFLCLMTLCSCNILVFVYSWSSKTISEKYSSLMTYQFYDTSNPEILYFTISFNILAIIFCAVIHVSLDTTFVGLFMVITGQLELNACRIEKLSRDDMLDMKSCVSHNILIREVTKKVESLVIGVVIPFFLFGMGIVCTSIFQASKYNLFSYNFAWIWVFAVSSLQQVFIYCWFGNQLMLTIVKMSYTTLNLLNQVYERN